MLQLQMCLYISLNTLKTTFSALAFSMLNTWKTSRSLFSSGTKLPAILHSEVILKTRHVPRLPSVVWLWDKLRSDMLRSCCGFVNAYSSDVLFCVILFSGAFLFPRHRSVFLCVRTCVKNSIRRTLPTSHFWRNIIGRMFIGVFSRGLSKLALW